MDVHDDNDVRRHLREPKVEAFNALLDAPDKTERDWKCIHALRALAESRSTLVRFMRDVKDASGYPGLVFESELVEHVRALKAKADGNAS